MPELSGRINPELALLNDMVHLHSVTTDKENSVYQKTCIAYLLPHFLDTRAFPI